MLLFPEQLPLSVSRASESLAPPLPGGLGSWRVAVGELGGSPAVRTDQAPAPGGPCRCRGLKKTPGGLLSMLPAPVGFYVCSQGPCQFPYFTPRGCCNVHFGLCGLLLVWMLCPQLLVVSDLFTERTQFEMMYLALAELRRVHPAEDEILIQYLVPATCKAAAVLGMVGDGGGGVHAGPPSLVLAECVGIALASEGLTREEGGTTQVNIPAFPYFPLGTWWQVGLSLGPLYPLLWITVCG